MEKVALITGASSGIGRELAIIHAKNGGDLVLIARNEKKLNKLKEYIEGKYKVEVVVMAKDLAKEDVAKQIYNEVKNEDIEIEYLINNAGFGGQGYFHERKWEDDLAMINVNIVALSALTRYFLADFVANNRGKILNVASVAAFMPGPLQAVYYATKAYVRSFSNALYEELSDTEVTVTALIPGAVKTGFANRSGMDKTKLFDKAVSPKKVAFEGYNAMLEGKIEVVSGMNKGLANLIKFVPKKVLLKTIKDKQKITKK